MSFRLEMSNSDALKGGFVLLCMASVGRCFGRNVKQRIKGAGAVTALAAVFFAEACLVYPEAGLDNILASSRINNSSNAVIFVVVVAISGALVGTFIEAIDYVSDRCIKH